MRSKCRYRTLGVPQIIVKNSFSALYFVSKVLGYSSLISFSIMLVAIYFQWFCLDIAITITVYEINFIRIGRKKTCFFFPEVAEMQTAFCIIMYPVIFVTLESLKKDTQV